MLRLIFFVLIVANAALYAFHQGYFTSSAQDKREPERLQGQINPGQIKLLPADAAKAPAAPAPAPEPTPAIQENQEAKLVECVEIGAFPVNQAKRVEERLASLALDKKKTRVNIDEVSSHMVYIPSLGSKEAADKKVAELEKMGIHNYFIMPDGAGNRWGISLGVFKTEQAAKKYQAEVAGKGVEGVKVAPRGMTTGRVLYRLRNLNADEVLAIDKLVADFPGQQIHSCSQ